MTWVKDKVFPDADSFIAWLDQNFGDYITKHISENHVHHTWIPNHTHNKKYTTLNLHKNMRSAHMNGNGWDDIAQNITIGKDGVIVTGRDIRWIPISAMYYNGTTDLHPFAYEIIGNFDKGNDKLEGKQLEAAVKISRYFEDKKKETKFHRELLINGKQPKSCPGTGVDKGWFMGLINTPPVKNGWKKESGKWYFYKDNKKQIGWIQDRGQWYFLDPNGVLIFGWLDWDSKRYYLKPEKESGAMVTGTLTIDGKLYHFNKDGSLVRNTELNIALKADKNGVLKP